MMIISVLAVVLFVAVTYLWMALATAAVLRKAGEETWTAWVPVYNGMMLFRLAGYSPYLGLLFLITPLAPFLWLVLSLRLNPAFGLSAGWAALAFFLPLVWLSVIGWGAASWHGLDVDDDPYPSTERESSRDPVASVGWPGGAQPQYAGSGFDGPSYARPMRGFDAAPTDHAPDPYAPADTTALVGPGAGAHDPWNPTPSPSNWESPSGWDSVHAADAADENTGAPAPIEERSRSAEPSWQAPEAASAPAWGTPAPAASSRSARVDGDDRARGEHPAPARPDVWAAPRTAAAEDSEADAPAPASASESPFAPPVQPLGRSSAFAPSADGVVPAAAPVGEDSQPRGPRRATRMRDDSEVIAQARAARMTAADDLDVTPDRGADDADDDAPPIIVPGPSAGMRGVVPPPPLPVSASEPDSAESSSIVDSGWQPPLRRPQLPDDVESSFGMSAEVSAVAGAPVAGNPRSAMSTVSAQQGTLGLPMDQPDDFEHTELSSRHRPSWMLQLPMSARPVEVTGTVVLLGRKPMADDAHPGAQLIPVADGTRTVSKTHARLELVRGQWKITDLGSTNGVVLFDADGAETEIDANVPAAVTERFLLGDAELRITQRSSS